MTAITIFLLNKDKTIAEELKIENFTDENEIQKTLKQIEKSNKPGIAISFSEQADVSVVHKMLLSVVAQNNSVKFAYLRNIYSDTLGLMIAESLVKKKLTSLILKNITVKPNILELMTNIIEAASIKILSLQNYTYTNNTVDSFKRLSTINQKFRQKTLPEFDQYIDKYSNIKTKIFNKNTSKSFVNKSQLNSHRATTSISRAVKTFRNSLAKCAR